ncbi:hypothetical protein GJAV_G00048010 [Gymnothorax javanicus]|nr:hypothetical protein GJAV_G00048010 [Gymnothorax javanicus]
MTNLCETGQRFCVRKNEFRTEKMQDFFCNGNLSNSTFLFENGQTVLWIQLVMAVLSIVGSGSIIVFTLFENLFGAHEVKALFFLSVANLLVCFTWLIGAILRNQSCNDHSACYNLHATEQIFCISSFFYTLNYTWVLYMGLKEDYCKSMTGRSTLVPGRTWLSTKMATLSPCILSVFLLVPVFAVGNLMGCPRNLTQSCGCLLMHSWVLYEIEAAPCNYIHAYSIAIFIITFVISLIGIAVLLKKAHSLYLRCMASTNGLLDNKEWANFRVHQRRIILFPTAFAFCWFPAFLLVILILFKQHQKAPSLYAVLYILQAFTSPSQGVLNCLFYGWTLQRFRFQTRERRDADTQTPLLRWQKEMQRTSAAQTD